MKIKAGDREIDEQELKEIYNQHLVEHRNRFEDVWNGMKLYLSLNTGIIGLAGYLLRLNSDPSRFGVMLVFVAGMAISILGFITVRLLRKYYMQSLSHVTFFEHLLGYQSVIDINDKGVKRKLSIRWFLLPHDHKEIDDKDKETMILHNPDEWVKKAIYHRGSTFYFMILHWIFFAINLVGFVFVTTGYYRIFQ